MKAFLRWFVAHRRRFAPLVLLGAAWVVGGEVFSAMPRDTEIRYRVGSDHPRVTDAQFAYLIDGQQVKAVRFHYDSGAPDFVDHRVSLAPGAYIVQAQLSGPELHRQVERRLVVPAEGRVRIDLASATARRAVETGDNGRSNTRWSNNGRSSASPVPARIASR